jgi:hypothetical protein
MQEPARWEVDENSAAQPDPATASPGPSVALELAGQNRQKAICLPAIIRTRAVDLITLDFNLPGVGPKALDFKGRRGQLHLCPRNGQAPIKLPGVVTSSGGIAMGRQQFRLGFKLTGLSPDAARVLEDLTTYPFQDMKCLWEQYDQARGGRLARRPNKDFYILAGGLILGGAVVSYSGLAYSRFLGGLLMIGGSLSGLFFAIRSLFYQRRAPHMQ